MAGPRLRYVPTNPTKGIRRATVGAPIVIGLMAQLDEYVALLVREEVLERYNKGILAQNFDRAVFVKDPLPNPLEQSPKVPRAVGRSLLKVLNPGATVLPLEHVASLASRSTTCLHI